MGGNERRERRNSGPLVFPCWAEGGVLQRQPQESSHAEPWRPPQSRQPGPGQPRGQPVVLLRGSGGGSDMGALAAGSVRHSSPSQESKWRWGGMGESSALDAGPGIPPDPCGQRLASQVMPWGTRYEGPQTPTAGHVFSNICVCCEQRI